MFFHSQLTRKDTLIDLKVFKDKNYTAGTIIQVVIQAVLYASLVILPQFLQSMMGYTAFLSGATMMPRGFGSLTAMVLTATLSNRLDNRLMVVAGLSLIGGAGLAFGMLNLQISNMNIAIPNYFMGMGMGLAMVPIMNLSVETLRNDQMTNATGIQNLLKNIGSAVGTSLVATMLTRFAQVHQYMLVGKCNELNNVFIERVQSTASALTAYANQSVAHYMAQYSMYGSLVEQANLWAFIDSFRIFGIICFLVIPLMLLFKKHKEAKETVENK